MKVGIVADEIDRNFARAVAIGKPLGLSRYEIRSLTTGRFPLCDAEEIREVERVAAREEVVITAISPGLFKYTEDGATFRREMREIYPRAAEWAHRWSLPGLIVFGFHKPGATEANAASIRPSDPPLQVIAWLAETAARAAADGLLLMIEPEPMCYADTGRATAEMICRAGGGPLRINYDPGNVAWLTNRDPIDEFDAVAPLIANVHVKDYRPGPVWLPAGDGIINYRAHFEALRRIRYKGPVSLEPHMEGCAENIRRCKLALEQSWQP
ncbi:MAG TPA: sugar phosphate isomerase/epimerase [Bryobacteraceae bacterium]|nr:sugar phosphate isomerase/epimerase [Bryobacteraceae bacterium]